MSQNHVHSSVASTPADDSSRIDLIYLLTIWGQHKAALLGIPMVIGAIALGVTFLFKPIFTAKTVFLPPQQQQSSATSALASLGAITGLSSLGGATKNPGDQYVALMQTANIEDRIIERFKLVDLYNVKYKFQASRELRSNVKILLGKKDGLITIEADATDPKLAAAIANQYVAELRRLTSELALTEAQQRRLFFETELKNTKNKLAAAQEALEVSGFTAATLRAEPKAAADGYAKLKAELTAAQVQLQTLRHSLTDSSAEVQRQYAVVAALNMQVAHLENETAPAKDSGYLRKYRDYKYQETLLEIFSKQYEMARLDESKDGGALQVIDIATAPEYKSKPSRLMLSLGVAMLAFCLLAAYFPLRFSWRQATHQPEKAPRLRALSGAWLRL